MSTAMTADGTHLITDPDYVYGLLPSDESSIDKIKSIETFRVRPRWLFVRVETEKGIVGWGEGTLEGKLIIILYPRSLQTCQLFLFFYDFQDILKLLKVLSKISQIDLLVGIQLILKIFVSFAHFSTYFSVRQNHNF